MKTSYALGVVALALFAGTVRGQDEKKPSLKELAWLAGVWEGDGFEEHWTTPIGGIMLGMGRLVKGTTTLFTEFIRIEEKDGAIVYQVHVDGQPKVDFTLVHQTSGESVFENKKHDFPQRIIYKQEGKDAITARIEGTQGEKIVQQKWKLTRVK